MVKESDTVVLWRLASERDIQRGYLVNSGTHSKLSTCEVLEEVVSHELGAGTRDVFYSFSISYDKVKAYQQKKGSGEICYVRLDLDALPKSVLRICPVYSRDYFACLISNCEEALSEGFVVNPSTGYSHSLLALLNTNQRTVTGWAHSLLEVMIQADHLIMTPYRGEQLESLSGEKLTQALIKASINRPSDENIKRLRKQISAEFDKYGLKHRYIYDRIVSNKWYAHAA